MTAPSTKMREGMLDLAWSLWTGLGVPGGIDRHADHCVDPEALIVFTAALGDADPRLRDEATDWCIRYGTLVSGARLKNLLADEDDTVRASYGELAATVNRHSSVRWPEGTTERPHEPRERPRIQSFNRASQLILRLRALVGVSARSEILRAFLATPTATFTAADLAQETGFTKRNVAQILDALSLGDVLQSFPVRNQRAFRMPPARAKQLNDQLAPMPKVFLPWPPVLHVLIALQSLLDRTESLPPEVRAVEARATMERLSDRLRLGRVSEPRRDLFGVEYWEGFVAWGLGLGEDLAEGKEPGTDCSQG